MIQGINGLNVNNMVFEAPLTRSVTEDVEDCCKSCLQRSPLHRFIMWQHVRSGQQD